MQWIKAHLNVVIAGTVSLLALVGLILGVLLPDVAAPLREDAALMSSLQSAQGASGSALAEFRDLQLKNHDTLVKQLQKYAEQGNHKPMAVTADLFPKENPNAQSAPFEFKRAFEAEQKALLTMLNAQGPPTEAEIREEYDILIRKHNQAQSEKDDPNKNKPRPGVNPLAHNVLGGANLQPNLAGGTPGQLPPLGPNATPEERVQKVPEARAAVNKARRIWCYATQANLDQRPAITEAQRPRLDDMWYAQMSLWVQQDILSALHKLNENRAKELSGEKPWVGNLPFKRLLSFNIGGYVPKADPAATGGGMAMGGAATEGVGGPPPMSGLAVMSKHGSTETVDVVQFTIEMIIEARALPAIIEQISNSGFYTVLQVGYEAEPPNPDLVGYIYGSKPVIKAWLLVEGSFLRTNKDYEKLIPDSVKEAIKAGRPVGGGGASTGGAAPGPTMMRGGMDGPFRGGRGRMGMEVPP